MDMNSTYSLSSYILLPPTAKRRFSRLWEGGYQDKSMTVFLPQAFPNSCLRKTQDPTQLEDSSDLRIFMLEVLQV